MATEEAIAIRQAEAEAAKQGMLREILDRVKNIESKLGADSPTQPTTMATPTASPAPPAFKPTAKPAP